MTDRDRAVPISISMPLSMVERLNALARDTRRSAIVRDAVTAHLRRLERRQKRSA